MQTAVDSPAYQKQTLVMFDYIEKKFEIHLQEV